MKLYDLIISRRTFREFLDKPVSREILERCVNAGRLAPQATNKQPLEFVVIDETNLCQQFFPLIKLAGRLQWKPKTDTRPKAYIAIAVNEQLQLPSWIEYDAALAAENICLTAWEEGVGSCLVGSFNKTQAGSLLNIPEKYHLALLVALGYPAHKSVVEEMKNDDVAYWRDEDGTFHVPKRPLKKIMHHNGFSTTKV